MTNIPVPPRLGFKFPMNVVCNNLPYVPLCLLSLMLSFPQVVGVSLPLLIPAFILLAIIRLTIDSRASHSRIKLLMSEREKDDSKSEYLRTLIRGLEKNVDDAIADLVDSPGEGDELNPGEEEGTQIQVQIQGVIGGGERVQLPSTGPIRPFKARSLTSSSSSSASSRASPSTPPTKPSSSSPLSGKEKENANANAKGPKLTPSQVRMARSLNSIPHLRKKLAYIEDVMNTHGVIIARDMKRFKWQERGLGVVRDWAESFVI